MDRKDAYIEKARASIEEYAGRLEQLKARAKGEVAELRIETIEQVDKLEIKLDEAKMRLAELTDAAENSWHDLSARFDVLADDLSASFKKFFEKH